MDAVQSVSLAASALFSLNLLLSSRAETGRRRRRRQTPYVLDVLDAEAVKQLDAAAVVRLLAAGRPVVLRGACAPLDALPRSANAGVTLFHPRKKLGALRLPWNAQFGEVQANIAAHEAEQKEGSPLRELRYLQGSTREQIRERNALYHERVLYGAT